MANSTQTRIITLSREGPVGVMTIHHPASKANPADFDFIRALSECIDQVRLDSDIKVAVLTGHGNFFSAGADIAQLSRMDPQTKAMFCLGCQETINKLEAMPKLVIAALNGHTVGGGLEVALACDLRCVAQEEEGFAPKIGLPEVKLGVLPGTGGTQRLSRLLGKQKALMLMIEGRTMPPDEALGLGLVDKVFPRDRLMAETLQYARPIAEGATQAVGLIKLAVQQGLEMPLSQGLALERELQNRLFITEDAREGLTAYNAQRRPNFRGR